MGTRLDTAYSGLADSENHFGPPIKNLTYTNLRILTPTFSRTVVAYPPLRQLTWGFLNMQQWNLISKIFVCALLFQAAPAQAPKTLLDNDRVVVRDVPGPATAEPLDSVVVFLSGAASGTAVFLSKGATPDISGRYILVGLKDHANVPVANTSGYPLAFPRPGAKKILENEKVIVWDNTWAPGVAAPMHFHDKDTIAVFLDDGDVKSTSLDGTVVVTPHTAGSASFNRANRTHTEMLASGKQRAIITELK